MKPTEQEIRNNPDNIDWVDVSIQMVFLLSCCIVRIIKRKLLLL
jgi:hypothetical protein